MDERTLRALKGSIWKWERIVDGTGEDRGASNCPLCGLFRLTTSCVGCPVYESTAMPYCDGSPYIQHVEHQYACTEKDRLDCDECKSTAIAERDFLISLLPENKVTADE